MKSFLCTLGFLCITTLSQSLVQPAKTQDAAQPAQPQAQQSNPPGSTTQPPATAPETEETGLFAGGDLYYGASNLPGSRHLYDGIWAAGAGLGYPSNLYVRLNRQSGAQAKIAVSAGKMYNGSTAFEQPVEAWWKQPLKKTGGSVTLGKFYVPFALQEWEYETKWGGLYEREFGSSTLAAALVYNRPLEKANGYARFGRQINKNINVGVSLAGGRGLTFDTVHDKAIGLDLTAEYGDWGLSAEYMGARGNSAERFRFGWVRLNYSGWEKFKPFVSRFDFEDTTGALGTFRSYSAGAAYALRSDLALESGYAVATGRNIWWAQIHWTPERKIK